MPLGVHAGEGSDQGSNPVFELQPLGWIRKSEGLTTLEIEKKYRPALVGLEELRIYLGFFIWFDRHDNPHQHSILRIHPRRNPSNTLRGLFAPRAPARPNLIAQSRCRMLPVHDATIEIDEIDAFPDPPVLDIKL